MVVMVSGPLLRAVIFDFDGVLADSEDWHCAAFQRVAGELGVVLLREQYYGDLLGLPDRACLAALCQRAGEEPTAVRLDMLVARKRALYAELSSQVHVYPGVIDVLQRLHPRFVLAIASGAFRDEIEAVLRRDAIDGLFAAVVGADDVPAGKPSPDPFLCALERINAVRAHHVAPSECVVIEDSPLGIRAARAAQMRCIGVATHHPPAALPADWVIDHLRELRVEDLLAL
jgi:HAD superfamily hydrolase (TIGR01509 family)